MYLALDTSTDNVSLALVEGDKVLAEAIWHTEQNQTTQVLPELDHLLKMVGKEMKDISAVLLPKALAVSAE